MQNLEEVSLGGHEDASDPPNLTAYDSKPHSSPCGRCIQVPLGIIEVITIYPRTPSWRYQERDW